MMSMDIFDSSEFDAAREKYAEEAKQKWGSTEAYKESSHKTASYSREKWNHLNTVMGEIFAEAAECVKRKTEPSDEKAQILVGKWKDFITENYYTCTKEILAGLGQMYVADERFTKNMDKYGEGTAKFLSEAIKIYCGV